MDAQVVGAEQLRHGAAVVEASERADREQIIDTGDADPQRRQAGEEPAVKQRTRAEAEIERRRQQDRQLMDCVPAVALGGC